MKNSTDCKHKGFISYPIEMTPTLIWKCSECDIEISPGEMIILNKLNELESQLKELKNEKNILDISAKKIGSY